jgi:hypothetical protein
LAKTRIAGPGVETPVDKRAAAIDKNTQRLRALRLAKEAADREAALLNPPPEKPKRKTASKK